jgi:hypothetical protein
MSLIARPFHEADGLAGHAHAAFELRADRHIVDIPAQQVTKIAVELVPAVIAHVFSQEARADPY